MMSLQRLNRAVALVGLIFASGWQAGTAAADEIVRFDVPAIAIAEPMDPSLAQQPTMGGNLLRLRIPVSTFISPNFQGTISEFIVEIISPQQSLRVIDYWPKTELYSDIQGTISVEDQRQKDQHFAFNVSGAYEPFGRGSAQGDFKSHANVEERYQRRPPMQLLTSSGTIHRGYGVFFKFRPGNVPVLEGDREIALLLEAPRGWRGDLLQVAMHAVGHVGGGMGNSRPQNLGGAKMWVATHFAGDQEASMAARRYVTREQAVRSMASSSGHAIEERATPTLFHKVGVALDVIEPKIPRDFLMQILFGAQDQYFNEATSRLPVDLKVAALDYWDERSRLMSLASR